MIQEDIIRVCRITRLHPRTSWPASGLTAYNLSRDLPYPCLYITKDLGDKPLPFPDHVRLEVISYPEPQLPEKMGWLKLAFIATGKLLGLTIFVFRALPFVVRFRPDIIHVHTLLTLPVGIAAKFISRVPLVLTIQGTDYYRLKTNRIFRGLVHFLLRQWVDGIICVSNDVERDLKSELPQKRVIYMPNAVDTELFHNQMRERRQQLITVGRLVWQKGLDHLLYAMKQVVANRPQTHLLIAGDGPLRLELEKLVNNLGLTHNVTISGTLSHAEIAQCLNDSRIFVLSSVTEGLPKAMLEAMSCGTPVVVTDVGGCKYVAQGAGLIVPPGESQALAGAILTLLADQTLWASASRCGQETAQKHTWEARARRMQLEYKRILEAS